MSALPLDYLTVYALLKMAGLPLPDCERGANLLSSIMPRRATSTMPDPAMLLVEDFLVLYETHAPSAWEYLEATAKRGYE